MLRNVELVIPSTITIGKPGIRSELSTENFRDSSSEDHHVQASHASNTTQCKDKPSVTPHTQLSVRTSLQSHLTDNSV